MLYFAPPNKASVTFYAWMVELVDTTDLKSVDPKGRAGSSPAPGTKREIAAMRSPVFGFFACNYSIKEGEGHGSLSLGLSIHCFMDAFVSLT